MEPSPHQTALLPATGLQDVLEKETAAWPSDAHPPSVHKREKMTARIPFTRMLLALAISIAGPVIAQTPQQQQNNSSGQTARVVALDVATRAQLMEAEIALIEEDYDFSLRTYRRLASRGIAEAQSYLGYMHANGLGVTRDYREALRLFRLAVEQNYASVLFNLGYMYKNGLGVPRDVAEGTRLYQIAADQGDPDALEFLNRFLSGPTGPPTPISNTRGNSSESQPSGVTSLDPSATTRPPASAPATTGAPSPPRQTSQNSVPEAQATSPGLASNQNWSASAASLRIDVGMTEQQAISRIGRNPERAEVPTPGLRMIHFGEIGNKLIVYFERDRNNWVIRSWGVYD